MQTSATPHAQLDAAIAHLADLIAYDTTSAYSNLKLIDHLDSFFTALGADVTVLPDESGEKANLVARLGPADIPGIVLRAIQTWCLPIPRAGRATHFKWNNAAASYSGVALVI